MKFIFLFFTLLISTLSFAGEPAKKVPVFKVGNSVYVSWAVWNYANENGILAKNAKEEGIEVKLVQFNDYIESVNNYTSGGLDAVSCAIGEAISIPAAGGVDSTVLLINDYSNGNDGIISTDVKSVAELKGKKIKLVELSVSHYLLARALEMNGLKEKDLKVVNTSDADLGSIFATSPKENVVTWNPILMNAKKVKNATVLFDSSKIPGEILDLLLVKTNADARLKRVLVKTWYEALAKVKAKDQETIAWLAKFSGGSVDDYNNQLATTHMFWTADESAKVMQDAKLKQTMDYIRTFSFDHGLLGQGAPNRNFVGIQFPDGNVLGNKANVKLRFDDSFTKGK